jgi:NAD(P)-dependent dehydrogenase (short-subunit alcohol dehydrogenase family)
MARIDRVGNLRTEAGMELDGRIALVTGVGKDTGIGFAVASALAGAGAHVIVTARTGAQAQAMAGRIGQGAEAMALDIADRAERGRRRRRRWRAARASRYPDLQRRGTRKLGAGRGHGRSRCGARHARRDAARHMGRGAGLPAALRQSDAGGLSMSPRVRGPTGIRPSGLTSGNAMGAGYGVAKAG